jgi:hypothetical protein
VTSARRSRLRKESKIHKIIIDNGDFKFQQNLKIPQK